MFENLYIQENIMPLNTSLETYTGEKIQKATISGNKLTLVFENETTAKELMEKIKKYPNDFNTMAYLFSNSKETTDNFSQSGNSIVIDIDTKAVGFNDCKNASEEAIEKALMFRIKDRLRRFFLLTINDFTIEKMTKDNLSIKVSKKEDAEWLINLLRSNTIEYLILGDVFGTGELPEKNIEISISLNNMPIFEKFSQRIKISNKENGFDTFQRFGAELFISIGTRNGRGLELYINTNSLDDSEKSAVNKMVDAINTAFQNKKTKTEKTVKQANKVAFLGPHNPDTDYTNLCIFLENSQIAPIKYDEVIKILKDAILSVSNVNTANPGTVIYPDLSQLQLNILGK